MPEGAPVAGYATEPGPVLAAAFDLVRETRMQDVPILNPALSVEAVGFAPWDAHWLGVLVTPWFMNLMLLPRTAEKWVRLRPGEKHTYVFPSGAFEFIGGREEAIGEYQSCSLFSPMFEFADHETARLTAEACLRALFDPQNRAEADVALRPKAEPTATAEEEPGAAEPPRGPGPLAELEARLQTPMSKRDFLRGGVLDRDTRG
ncbi:MAG TPA: [NiFe]-hydrogenase assembly chaperone HybE [Burkholderiales bacterium]|nr:[NiFe]-hydrogenase assembly chaperone HybE [Burkholderiales bacterium]